MVYSSCWTKGLGISSVPSAGEIRTRSVPRATTRPRERVVSLLRRLEMRILDHIFLN